MGEDMRAAFLASPDYAALARSLPADAAVMLRKAGEKRIQDYLAAQPPTRILSLETGLEASTDAFTDVLGRQIRLVGKADRVDLRRFEQKDSPVAPGIHILDYKTGRMPHMDKSLWENEALWAGMESWRADAPSAEDKAAALLRELAESMQSLQLPFYLLLYGLDARNPEGARANLMPLPDFCNAAWVNLAGNGEEKMLFDHNISLNTWDFVIPRASILVDFLLRHMLLSPMLSPRPGDHCRWCFSAKLCIESHS